MLCTYTILRTVHKSSKKVDITDMPGLKKRTLTIDLPFDI